MKGIAAALVALALAAAASRHSEGASYAIVDTGQDAFYNNSASIMAPTSGQAFYGQDAHYAGSQPSYTTSGDGQSVLDSVTGLTWSQSADWSGDGTVDADDKFTYSELQSQADALNAQNYGGYSDWRVPTIKQLYSLIDYRGTDPNPMASDSSGLTPFLDDNVFEFAYGDTNADERIIDSQWGTSTLYGGTVMNNQTAMFGVNFADGRIKGYPAFDGPGGVDKTYYARFVRGNEAYGENDLADNGDGTVTDQATNLMWAQADSGEGMNWEGSLAYAEGATLAGYDDWRLPNAKELQSLLDYERSPDTSDSAAIDPLFDATEITNEAGEADYPFYWSGTTFLSSTGSADQAVYVSFGRGLGTMDGDNVIDVHGAGCQRSDPKSGDSDDYPSWGNGPQGDVQRVFNFVRLVRDVTGLAGDFNGDGRVDAADYTVWRDGFGTTYTLEHYDQWQANFAQPSTGAAALSTSAPTPSAMSLLLVWCFAVLKRKTPRPGWPDETAEH